MVATVTKPRSLHNAFKQRVILALLHWEDVCVECIPGVMLRIRFDEDSSNEYRMHWFCDANETYVHNHVYGFTTVCIEGSYEERTWEIVPSDGVTYQFDREKGGALSDPIEVSGSLAIVRTRNHFPGNVMEVHQKWFHSIQAPSPEAVTFVIRHKAQAGTTKILCSHKTLPNSTEVVRPATPAERSAMQTKLASLLFKTPHE